MPKFQIHNPDFNPIEFDRVKTESEDEAFHGSTFL